MTRFQLGRRRQPDAIDKAVEKLVEERIDKQCAAMTEENERLAEENENLKLDLIAEIAHRKRLEQKIKKYLNRNDKPA